MVQVLGLSAGAVIIIASLPQILKIVKTKKTRDISLQMYILLNIGTLMWIVYGYVTNQPAVLIPNAVAQIFNVTILYLKLKNG